MLVAIAVTVACAVVTGWMIITKPESAEEKRMRAWRVERAGRDLRLARWRSAGYLTGYANEYGDYPGKNKR